MVRLISLLNGEYTWKASHTRTFFFLTLWIFWGLTVGHLSQAELLIIVAELCMETPKQKSAAKRTSFCPRSLFSLFTPTKRRVCRLRCCFQMLSAYLKQKQVFGFLLKEQRLYHWRRCFVIWFSAISSRQQIFKHVLTRDLPLLPR